MKASSDIHRRVQARAAIARMGAATRTQETTVCPRTPTRRRPWPWAVAVDDGRSAQWAEELGPEDLGFAVADRVAKDLAAAIDGHPGRDDDGLGDHPPGDTATSVKMNRSTASPSRRRLLADRRIAAPMSSRSQMRSST